MDRNQSDNFREDGEKVFEVKLIPVVLAILTGVFLGWIVAAITTFPHTEIIAGAGAGLLSALTLTVRSVTVPSRLGTMIKADCWLFLVVSMIVSVALALWCYVPKYFIIADGLILLIFLSSVYKLSKTGV